MRPALTSLLLLLVACNQPPPATVALPSAQDELNAMDGRKPLPLLPMMAEHQKEQMRGHLMVIEEIVGAMAKEDWAAVEASARRMGSSPAMAQTCEHMGAGADGFTEQALDFHSRADAIAEAARTGDRAAVLEATHHTLQACTGCHEAWRQEVVNSEEWGARTGGAEMGHP